MRSGPGRRDRGRPARIALAVLTLAALATSSPLLFAAPPDRGGVPEVVDLPEPVAAAALKAAGFQTVAKDAPGDPAGTVARQVPVGFGRAAPGGPVTIWVRRGGGGTPPSPSGVPPAAPPMPDVRGKREGEALEMLKPWRVRTTVVVGTPDNDGRVVAQAPAAGAAHPAGALVELTVARAAAPAGTAVVPTVVGLEQEAASQALSQAHLVPLVTFANADPADAGRVVSQDPPPGTTVARQSNVAITVGRNVIGPLVEIEVPDTLKQSEADARAALERAGLLAGVRYQLSPKFPGVVLNQDPVPGTRVLRGRTVSLVVGVDRLVPQDVPSTIGLDAAAAEQTLRDAGFASEQVLAVSLPGSAGKVIAQDPPAGTSAIRGSTVRITVGRPTAVVPVTVAVPSLVGRAEIDARAALETAGLVAEIVPVAGPPPEWGRVKSQSVPPGAGVPRGTSIRLEVARGDVGPPGIVLKSYVGMDVAAAQADLTAQGLQSQTTRVDGTPAGRVISQDPPAGARVAPGTSIVLTVLHQPPLPTVVLTGPPDRQSVPKQHGVTFNWMPVPEADDYQFYIDVEKDGTWVTADNDVVGANYKKPSHVNRGRYRWHVRARRAGGTILGPWSEWRLLSIY
jgi:beta-lactam-binding protein with PASTA domain